MTLEGLSVRCKTWREDKLFILLYLRPVAIVITVGPDIQACCLDGVFGAEHCSLVYKSALVLRTFLLVHSFQESRTRLPVVLYKSAFNYEGET